MEDVMTECPWTSESECLMARERAVAGIDNAIPECPVHGEFQEDMSLEEELNRRDAIGG